MKKFGHIKKLYESLLSFFFFFAAYEYSPDSEIASITVGASVAPAPDDSDEDVADKVTSYLFVRDILSKPLKRLDNFAYIGNQLQC